MHKSRLGVVVIDCEGDSLEEAEAFWSQALGYEVEHSDDPANSNYAKLRTPPGEMAVLLQKVSHPSRVHLDIETDDMDAEVQRLEALGARRVAYIKRWWVMEAPSGHRFCVVQPQREGFDQEANQWR